MKAYFSASRYYREEFLEVYEKIIQVLKNAGCQVVDNTTKNFKDIPDWKTDKEKEDKYEKMLKQMNKTNFSVFEASFPSTLHIGHEITLSMQKSKPVIVLYREDEGREPMLFKGIKNDKIIWVKYNLKNLEEKLQSAVEEAKAIQDVRFNFFVSPKLLSYLDWISKNRMVPRSVFLRDLIEKEMKKDKKFKQF
jgi:hypothetical protein